jgi:maltose alpha-D-glucosyltransferase/alpha-amylase
MADAMRNHDEQPMKWVEALAALHGSEFMEYLHGCRWFGGKAQTLRGVQVMEELSVGEAGKLILLQADYHGAPSETYLLPLQLAAEDGVLVDALDDEDFRAALLKMIVNEQRLRCGSGELVGSCCAEFKAEAKEMGQLASRVLEVEQSNSAILYDDRFFLKIFRRPELGENPDVELLRYFSEGNKFANVPGYCGAIEYRGQGEKPRVLALLATNVPNEGTAWASTLKALGQWQDEAVGVHHLKRVRLLGKRTAQMHLALAVPTEDPDFAPEAITEAYRNSLCQNMAEATRHMMELLEQKVDALPDGIRGEVVDLLRREQEILQRHSRLMDGQVNAMRIRIHGDYHLGQVLDTGDDFIIIDFEGEPARPLNERRTKHSPLRDVAGMLRSFDYAAHTAMSQRGEDAWVGRVSGDFLNAYLTTVKGTSFLPTNDQELQTLLDVCLLEKAVYEVCYELNNRPDWVAIPLRGITRILDRRAGR